MVETLLSLMRDWVEVHQPADVRLVVVHPRRKKCGFSGEIFDQDADVVPLDLFMRDAVDQYVGILVLRQPVSQLLPGL